MGQNHPRIGLCGGDCLGKKREIPREEIDRLTIGGTVYEITSVYDGKVTLLDLVKSSLRRCTQQALRMLKSP
jgi:hypothetical protein